MEMILTGGSENGALLGWDRSPLKQSAKIWLHNAGITHVHQLVGGVGVYGDEVVSPEESMSSRAPSVMETRVVSMGNQVGREY